MADNFRVYTYKLHLTNSIKAPSTPLEELTLSKESGMDFTSEVNEVKVTFTMTMTGLKFTRKIYEPGIIEAEVAIKKKTDTSGTANNTQGADMPDMEDVKRLLENRYAKLGIIVDKEIFIAENYYVFKVNPQIVSDNGKLVMYVKLTINSMDKLMTIDKYSKAYVAKKLGSDILNYESRSFGFDTESSLIQPDYQNLQHLKYDHNMLMDDTNDQKVTVNIPSERIQPYLVQYNESFYNFLVRTANRCGEFVFFEDGQLHLGLPDSDVIEISTYDNVTLQDYTEGPIDTQFYSRDSVKDDETIGDLNFDTIDKDDAGYPTDSFPEKVARNAEVASDDFIFPLQKDKFTSIAREMGVRKDEALSTVLLGATQEVVGNTEGGWLGVAEVVRSFATTLANGAITAYKDSKETNDDCNESYIDNFAKKTQQCNGNVTVPFASQIKKGWTSREFYDDIWEHQYEQQHKIICIDMGQNYVGVKLGGKITVKGMSGKYIVIEIRQIANENWTRNYRRFEEDGTSQDNYSGSQSQIIYAIPTYSLDGSTTDLVVPPFAKVSPICKAGPQTAFVVDNKDPKYQGRVRIVFPWQSSNDISRKKLYEAQDALPKIKAKADKAKTDLENLEETLKDIKLQKTTLEELQGKSQADIDKKRQDLKKEKETIDERIKKLEEQTKDLDEGTILSKSEYAARQSAIAELAKKKAEKAKIEALLKLLDNKGATDIDLIIKFLDDEVSKQTEAKNTVELAVITAQKELDDAKENIDKAAEDWEKNLKSMATPWVRVATPMASDGGGTYFKPQKGDEVLVNFDSDNIERPYVVGSVFSKNLTEPGSDVAVAGRDMTMMSPNGQYISFKSPGNAWGFVNGFFPLIKTLQNFIPDMKGEVLKGDEKGLSGDIVMSDRFGMFEVKLSSDKRAININSPYGKVDIGAFTGITISAPNGNVKISGKNVTIEAGNNLTLKSGTNVKESDSISDIIKQMAKDTVKSIISEQVGSLKPFDMALLRNVIEIFLRPIEGTMLIKSNNYVMLEAGEGKAKVPLERYSEDFQEFNKMEPDTNKQIFYAKTIAYIKRIDQRVTAFVEDYQKLKAEAFKQQTAYEDNINVFWKDDVEKPKIKDKVYKLGTGEYKKTDDATPTFDLAEFKDENYKTGTSFTLKDGTVVASTDLKDHMKPLIDSFAGAVEALQKKGHNFDKIFDDETVRLVNQFLYRKNNNAETEWIDKAFKKAVFDATDGLTKKTLDKWNTRYGAEGADATANFLKAGDENSKDDPYNNAKLLKRRIIATFLWKLFKSDGNVKDPLQAVPEYGKFISLSYKETDINDDKFLDNNWRMVSALGDNVWVSDSFKKKGMSLLKLAGEITDLEDYVKKFYDPSKPKGGWAHTVWNEKSGQIIFSSEKSATYTLGESINKYSMSSSKNITKLKEAITEVK